MNKTSKIITVWDVVIPIALVMLVGLSFSFAYYSKTTRDTYMVCKDDSYERHFVGEYEVQGMNVLDLESGAHYNLYMCERKTIK